MAGNPRLGYAAKIGPIHPQGAITNKEINLCDLKEYGGMAELPWCLVCTGIVLTVRFG